VQLSAGADAKNADTDMALEAQSLWQGLIASFLAMTVSAMTTLSLRSPQG